MQSYVIKTFITLASNISGCMPWTRCIANISLSAYTEKKDSQLQQAASTELNLKCNKNKLSSVQTLNKDLQTYS